MPRFSNVVDCLELYEYGLTVVPNWMKPWEMALLVKQVLPDVQNWQYAGALIRPPRQRHFTKPDYLHVHFQFRSSGDRQQVADYFTSLGHQWSIADQPADDFVIVV